MNGELPLGLEAFFEGWELYTEGVLAGVVMGLVLGLLGVYIVLRRLVFLSAALGQASSLGVVVALTFGATLSGEREVTAPVLGAFAFAFGASLFISHRKRASNVQRDGLLGAIYLVGAAGTLLLGSRMAHEMHEIEALLHGVGVAVMPEDLHLVLGMAVVVLTLQVFGWRAFAGVAFDPVGAAVRRVPVGLVEILMSLCIAAAFAAGIRALGALPVFALSVVPALAAIRLARTLPTALAIGAWLGAVSGYQGYALAFVLDAPVGASQTLVALVLVGGVLAARAVGRAVQAPHHAADGGRLRARRALGRVLAALAALSLLTPGAGGALLGAALAIGAAALFGAVAGLGHRAVLGLVAVLAVVLALVGEPAPGLAELAVPAVLTSLATLGAEHLRAEGPGRRRRRAAPDDGAAG
jgi:zinc transport system permease protein